MTIKVGDILRCVEGDGVYLLEVVFVTDHHAHFQDGSRELLSAIAAPHFVPVTSRWEILLFRTGKVIIRFFNLLP